MKVLLFVVVAVLALGPLRRTCLRFWPFTFFALPGFLLGFFIGAHFAGTGLCQQLPISLPLFGGVVMAVLCGKLGWETFGWLAKGKWPEEKK